MLDPGERDAIILARKLKADQLIVADRQGRREAEKRGILVIGTLGVMREAATLGLLDLKFLHRTGDPEKVVERSALDWAGADPK
jgi:hypothetical protein